MRFIGRFRKQNQEQVWIWNFELRQLGFTQKSDRYWQCSKGFGLAPGEHLSLFLPAGNRSSRKPRHFELTEFHVTIQSSIHHLHFYFHEVNENCWESGGHTSSREIASLGNCPQELGQIAELIAEEFIAAIGGSKVDPDTGGRYE